MGMRRFFGSTFGSAGVAIAGYLDNFPNLQDSFAAWSTRKVYGSYSGDCMRITTDNINFEEIGFLSNGNIDEQAIIDYCGLNIGYVRVFYDQSGNSRDLSAGLLATMPSIYDGTSIYKKNGVPVINFIGVNRSFSHNIIGTPPSIFSSGYYISSVNGTQGQIWFSNSLSFYGLTAQGGSTNTTFRSNYGTPTVYKNKVLQSLANRGDVYTMINNGGIIVEDSANISTWTLLTNLFRVGLQQGGAFILEGELNDIIQFDKAITSTDKDDLSDAINSPYSIY